MNVELAAAVAPCRLHAATARIDGTVVPAGRGRGILSR